jgi:hypothetical protein
MPIYNLRDGNSPVGGRSSETLSHSLDMTIKATVSSKLVDFIFSLFVFCMLAYVDAPCCYHQCVQRMLGSCHSLGG